MSFVLPTGAPPPAFDLPGSDGRRHAFADLKGPNGTLLFFTCNHCPYVIGSEDRMQSLFDRIVPAGVSMLAIHSNETKDHPTDGWDAVLARTREKGFRWLSLRDEEQLVAKAFGAERTPHYFLFGKDERLAYAGRQDNSPRDASKAETHELDDAIADMLAGRPVKVPRTDPIGCNIKWWDKEKHWMPGEACDLDYLYRRSGAKQA